MRGMWKFQVVVSLTFAALLVGQAQAENGGDFVVAAASEAAIADNLPRQAWDQETIREMGRTIGSLSDEVAAELIWIVACISPNLDTSSFFSSALTSPSATVRGIAASTLIADSTPVSRRLILSMLQTEREPDVIWTIAQGFANLPKNTAIRTLMDVILTPGLSQEVVRDLAQELRRLTRAEVIDEPAAWRDWWLDNEELYLER